MPRSGPDDPARITDPPLNRRRVAIDSSLTLLLRTLGAIGPLISFFLIAGVSSDMRLFGLWASMSSMALAASLADLGNWQLPSFAPSPVAATGPPPRVSRSRTRRLPEDRIRRVVGAGRRRGNRDSHLREPRIRSYAPRGRRVTLATLVPVCLWIPLRSLCASVRR